MIKSGIEIIPLPYEQIRSFLTGYRGTMVQPEYAEGTFQNMLGHFQGQNGGTLLELGPGGSLLSGLLGRIAGFDRCILIDVGDFISRDLILYDKYIKNLSEKDYNLFKYKHTELGGLVESFSAIGIVYLTNGLASLRKTPTNSISFSFSNAVLEHVRKNEFFSTVKELYRIHIPGSISVHQIDYKDHLASSLNNLRFPGKVWESRFFPNSGFYTNRLRHQDLLKVFIQCGFSIEHEEVVSWNQMTLPRTKMAEEFRSYSDKQLKIRGGRVVLKKIG